jgi:hypothetical protein
MKLRYHYIEIHRGLIPEAGEDAETGTAPLISELMERARAWNDNRRARGL